MFILSLCDVPEVLEVLQIVEVVIMAFRIAAPIILIVSGMITLMNTIKSGNEDLLAKSKKVLINKIIAAVLIFFVPLLVELIIRVAGGDTDYKNCININESTINSAYSSNANRYMDSAKSNLSRSDYDRAQSSINKITDEDLKKKYQDRLDEIGKLIDESNGSNGSSGNGGYNNTTTRYSAGGNYGNNTTTKYSGGGNGNGSGNGSSGQKTTTSSKTMDGTYYLGDSRTNGLASTLESNENVIAKDGGNYNDFVTHTSTLKSKLKNSTGNYNIVLNYGVNDLGNVNKYCEGYKSLANTIGSNHKVYVVSVNPMNDSTKWNATNASINSFNSSMKSCISSVSNITYCDVNSTASNDKWVKDYLSSDGLHYNNNGYKYIHSKILSCIG